jgi:UDP-GlcNAc:undecaprenyl-phosphate/decaprenyl-phosphate GlcNAc-1-phosphate transferase
MIPSAMIGLLSFAVALLASLTLTIPVRQFALRVGMVDRPGHRKIHLEPIPLLGGIAIYAAVLLAMLFSGGGEAFTQIMAILAGATLVVMVGTADDRGLLHHQIKLFVAMPIAASILLASGIHAQVFSLLWPGTAGSFADAALTIFWITGITASFSILDYMDGLCAGIAAVAALFFAFLAALHGQIWVSALAAAVMGAALGFLRWNFNPARIFMGDGGAMLLGFLMATLSVKLRLAGVSTTAGIFAPALVLGATIFDTTLVSISRSRRGLLPFTTPGKDHTAHRLSNCGFGTRRAVLAMYVLGCVFGLLALFVSRLDSRHTLIAMAAIVIAVLLGVAALEQAPYERQQRKPKTEHQPVD